MFPRFAALLGALGAAGLVACGAPSSPAPPSPAATDPCLITDSAASARDTLRVALVTPVAATRAPLPTTDAERIVFRQLYETLVRVDCAGAIRPALATRWRREQEGTRWLFDLAPGARFWDGTPLDAAALRAAWSGAPGLVVASVEPASGHGVVVSLTAAQPIEAFGDAAWAVVKRIPESPWPIGTGPVWVRDWDIEGGTRVLRARPTPFAPTGTPVIEFHAVADADPRDVLDRAVDLVVARNAVAIRYAAGRGDWRDVPLPWDRVYVVASPLRHRSGTTTQLDAAARLELARDAVRDDARPAAAEPWWADARCPPGLLGLPAVAGREAQAPLESVLVPSDDRVATDLVARLVARRDAELGLLLGGAGGRLLAGRLEPGDYAAQLAAGHAPAFVVALPRHPLDACRAIAELRARAPWLHAVGAWSGDLVAPLVETRAHLLLRAVRTVALDHDGGVRVAPGPRP